MMDIELAATERQINSIHKVDDNKQLIDKDKRLWDSLFVFNVWIASPDLQKMSGLFYAGDHHWFIWKIVKIPAQKIPTAEYHPGNKIIEELNVTRFKINKINPF